MDKREADRFLNRIYNPSDEFEVLYRHEDGAVARKKRSMPSDPEEMLTLLDEFERAEDNGAPQGREVPDYLTDPTFDQLSAYIL